MKNIKLIFLIFLSAFAAKSECSINRGRFVGVQKQKNLSDGYDSIPFFLSPSAWVKNKWASMFKNNQDMPVHEQEQEQKYAASTAAAHSAEPKEQITPAKRSWAAVYNGAVGDALGRVTEFIQTNTQNITQLSQAVRPDHGFANYTDDTVMALIVLEEMKNARKNQLNDQQITDSLARKFAELLGEKTKYTVDPLFAIRTHGPGNSAAGQELSLFIEQKWDNSNTTWWLSRSGKAETEAGCGSAMRAWPIGLVFHDDLERAARLADMQSQITHRHPLARAASAALAVGTALAYTGKSVEEIVDGMIAAAEKFDAEELPFKKQATKKAAGQLLTPAMVAGDQLLTSDMLRYAAQGARAGKLPADILGTHNTRGQNFRSPKGYLLGWAADEAVSAALYLFVRHAAAKNVDGAIAEGVNTPGDSDSIASLAGVLMGAYTGKLYQNGKDSQLLEGIASGKLEAAVKLLE